MSAIGRGVVRERLRQDVEGEGSMAGAERAGIPEVAFPHRNDSSPGVIRDVIDFSSKALHHYLILSEKLLAEKDLRLKERETQLTEKRQAIAELETYVQMLEAELSRQRQKPEGWS